MPEEGLSEERSPPGGGRRVAPCQGPSPRHLPPLQQKGSGGTCWPWQGASNPQRGGRHCCWQAQAASSTPKKARRGGRGEKRSPSRPMRQSQARTPARPFPRAPQELRLIHTHAEAQSPPLPRDSPLSITADHTDLFAAAAAQPFGSMSDTRHVPCGAAASLVRG